MTNGERKIDWSNLWRNEDWWSCWLGWFILLLGMLKLLPDGPKIQKWSAVSQIFPDGAGTIGTTIIFLVFSLVITLIAVAIMKVDWKKYVIGFPIIFIIAFFSMVISKQAFFAKWGIEYVIFALIIGLIISNVFKVPEFMRAAGQTEFFVKIGLVCMGATILFTELVEAGLFGVAQALLVATVVWFMTYFICRAFKVSERFSAIIATANSICGVSATIAAGGAIQGDPKEVSYMVAWVLVCAVVLIIIMPPIARWLELPAPWAGAWIGGVIDNTGAVVAAGGMIKGEVAVKVASIVKMAQNVLIGVVAFLMALWATISLDRRDHPELEKPSFMEIWFRFPKFVVGFMIASIIASFIMMPAFGAKGTGAITKVVKSYRNWFFALCFVSIGLETNFKELISVGGGRPAIAYWLAQTANAFWTLFIAWLLWSGVIFSLPSFAQ